MAKWHCYKGERAPQCTHCGMWAGFARYRRGRGVNARELSDYCPNCGYQMTSADRCVGCPDADKEGNWQKNGICFGCRDNPWTEAEIPKTNAISQKGNLEEDIFYEIQN